jgi:hypothetical protein
MSFESVIAPLDSKQQTILRAVKKHAESLLDHSPRFKFFTLHGTTHIENLFGILQLLIDGGIKLKPDELYLLSLAICVHDLGMVVSLRDYDVTKVLDGRPAATDPAALELFIRETHHELVDEYFRRNVDFLIPLGVSPNQLAQVVDISRCHRKLVLEQQVGIIRFLGAMLRVIDELDVGSNRAPADVLLNLIDDMDATSCWHWFKHNITEPWLLDHTVFYLTENRRQRIQFRLAVRPTKQASVTYWLHQVLRTIRDGRVEEKSALKRKVIEIEKEINGTYAIADTLGLAIDPKYQLRSFADFDVAGVISRAIVQVSGEAQERKIHIEFKRPSRNLTLWGDEQAVQQCLVSY